MFAYLKLLPDRFEKDRLETQPLNKLFTMRMEEKKEVRRLKEKNQKEIFWGTVEKRLKLIKLIQKRSIKLKKSKACRKSIERIIEMNSVMICNRVDHLGA